LLQASGPATD